MATDIKKPTINNIDQYIALFPEATQEALDLVRATINKAVPGMQEVISYSIPAFKFNGKTLIFFAGYKAHVGLYAVPTDHPLLQKDIAGYTISGKGTIQFSLKDPIPTALITKIVKLMLKEHLLRINKKPSKK